MEKNNQSLVLLWCCLQKKSRESSWNTSQSHESEKLCLVFISVCGRVCLYMCSCHSMHVRTAFGTGFSPSKLRQGLFFLWLHRLVQASCSLSFQEVPVCPGTAGIAGVYHYTYLFTQVPRSESGHQAFTTNPLSLLSGLAGGFLLCV